MLPCTLPPSIRQFEVALANRLRAGAPNPQEGSSQLLLLLLGLALPEEPGRVRHTRHQHYAPAPACRDTALGLLPSTQGQQLLRVSPGLRAVADRAGLNLQREYLPVKITSEHVRHRHFTE